MNYLVTGQTRQKMDGFGICMAFHQAEQLRKFPACEEILALLFDHAGVSVLRNIVGDGGVWGNELDGPTPTIEPEKNVWVPLADEGQQWLVEQAAARGCHRVFASVWSPPAWMKTNACVHDGGKLRRDCYAAYAEYLVHYLRAYRQRFGIELYAISPANEPTTHTQYSSCLWDGEDFHDFLKEALLPALRDTGLTSKLIIPETENFGPDFEKYYAPTLDDAEICAAVDIVAEHGYGNSVIAPLAKATEKKKTVWLTEMCDIGVLKAEEKGNGIENGVAWAANIHRYLTQAQVSCYCYFWGASIYHEGNGSLVGMNLETGRPTYTKRISTFGNFSRFIRPGAVRLAVETEDNAAEEGTGLLLSAYRAENGRDTIVVCVNESRQKQPLTVRFEKPGGRRCAPFRTSATEALAPLPEELLVDGTLQTEVPPQSVTTWKIY